MSEAKCAFQGFDRSGYLPDLTQKPCGKPATGRSCHYGGDTLTCDEHHCAHVRPVLEVRPTDILNAIQRRATSLSFELVQELRPMQCVAVLACTLGKLLAAALEGQETFQSIFERMKLAAVIEESFYRERHLQQTSPETAVLVVQTEQGASVHYPTSPEERN